MTCIGNKRFIRALATLLLLVAEQSHADCWSEVEARYSVSKYLLLAIAQHESGLDSSAVNKNSDGSYDIGLMQINTTWLPVLKQYGIGVAELKNPCLNLNIGAWILANNFIVYGKNWRAVGAYNARTEWKRASYANQVAIKLKKIVLIYGINQ